jgi:very-short-patch-repair endonuclease
MTDAENLLWTRIRNKQLKGYQFYRQKVIENEMVRFYCSRANLMIEVDGGQHDDNKAKQKD